MKGPHSENSETFINVRERKLTPVSSQQTNTVLKHNNKL